MPGPEPAPSEFPWPLLLSAVEREERFLFRQALQPRFTAGAIFGTRSAESHPIVREVVFGNLAIGTLGICSLYHPGWIMTAAAVGGLYCGLAALGHVIRKGKNAMEQTAMISGAFAFFVLLVIVVRDWA
jgi:hypothetical protein